MKLNAKRTDPQFSSLGISRMLLVKRTQMNFFYENNTYPLIDQAYQLALLQRV